jgi:hypothetical protein
MSELAIVLGALLLGWAVGIFHSERMCAAHGKSLMDTHDAPHPSKNRESDMLLRNQAAIAFGLAWRIGLWIRPWKWGRASDGTSTRGSGAQIG